MNTGQTTRRVFLERLLPALTHDLGFKLIALLLAAGAWAWVQTERVVERRVRVHIQYDWPEQLVRVDEVRNTLVVTVSGPQGLVRTLDRRSLSVPIDLSDSEEGPVSIDFTARTISGLPSGLQVVQVSPPAMDFQLDRRMTRVVQVRPAVIGAPAEGWTQISIHVDPDTAEITGPESLVRNIAEVSTDIVDVSGARSDIERTVHLAIHERTVTPTGDGTTKVRVDLEPVLSRRVFDGVPVLPRAPGWRVDQQQVRVTLSGPVKVLEELQPEQLNVVVHLPEDQDIPSPITLQFDPSADRPIEVIHPGPRGQLKVQALEPSTITLEKIP